MQYSVVIPTNRSIASVLPTLQSLQDQTFTPKEIIIVYDKILTQHDYDTMVHIIHQNIQTGLIDRIILITHLTHDFDPGKGVSYVRNTGIRYSTAGYLLLIDDDNTIASDFMQRMAEICLLIQNTYHTYPLCVPTEYHKQSIRSRGYRTFSYLFGLPIPYHEERGFMIGKEYVGKIQFSSSNCLFGHKSIFVAHPFDESIPFIYEDFIMTADVHRAGIPVMILHSLIVNHHMRTKTILEQSYINTTIHAYRKAKNRIVFVRTLGNSFQKIVYFSIGLPLHTIALLLKVVRYSAGRQRRKLCAAILHGTWD